MKKREGQGWIVNLWLVIRWPLVLAFTAFAFVVFLIGIMSALGYQGSTPLRAVSANNKLWTDFEKLFKQAKGAPYFWYDNVAPPQKYGLVKFDKRLIRALTYLSQQKDAKCGWNGQHQKIGLKVGGPVDSDLSYQIGNLRSVSTLYRGVGVRIVAADEIKCTIICQDGIPHVFDQKLIELSQSKTLSPDKPYDQTRCHVTCAVDYYPYSPVDAPSDEITHPVSAQMVSSYDPGEFDYQTIAENGKKAAVYKAVQIGYELMQIDEAGCEKATGNKGFNRAIPNTIIFPRWIMSMMGDDWQKFLDLAKLRFPYNFQKGSPLAGLAYDPLLDYKGLHLNY